jgi:hypothetical protein
MARPPVRVILPLWKKLVYAALLTAFVLACLELLLRGCGCGPPAEPAARAAASTGVPGLDPLSYFAVCDPVLGIRNRPHGSYRSWYIRGEPLCTTDELGYRNGFGWPGYPLGGGESPIVLFVGDSVTFCSEVEDQQTGPSEVAKLLSRQFDVRVLNAGVRSYSTLQAKRMLLECFERFPNVQAAVYTFCGNDLEENVVPNFRFPLKAPYLLRDERTGRFREVEISDPVIPWGEYFCGWHAPQPDPSSGTRMIQWLGARSALFYRCLMGVRRIDFAAWRPLEFPDGKHAVPVSEYAKWHDWAAQNGGNDALRQLLAEMDQICRRHAAAFLATSAFNGSDRVSCRAFATNCAAAGVQFISLEHAFTGAPSLYMCARVDGRLDEHYGPLGTRTYARALAPAIERILRSQPSGPKGGGS